MTILEAFESFEKCPLRGKIYKRLSNKERIDCVAFIVHNEDLPKWEFEQKLNRWLIDEEKPKRFTDMWSLVLEANSKSRG